MICDIHSVWRGVCVLVIIMAFSGTAMGEGWTPIYQLSILDNQSSQSDGEGQADGQSSFAWQTPHEERWSNGTGPQSVISLVGSVGVIVDNAASHPRFRGLSLIQDQNVGILATGQVAPGFEDVTAQLALTFRF
ncbi:MAG: hypothetical protein AAF409_15645 [Pseudomonadota bacterium]